MPVDLSRAPQGRRNEKATMMRILVPTLRTLAVPSALAAAAFLLAPGPAGACSGTCSATAPIALSASVQASCSLNVTGSPAIDLTQTGSATWTVTEKCNAKNGYNIKVKSLNGSKLKGGTGNNDEVAYTLTYAGIGVTVTSPGTYSSDVYSTAQGKTGSEGLDRSVIVSWTGSYLTEDTYADTLTVSLTAP
jgi:hypothetical protein